MLIGIIGKAGAGKDTACKYLQLINSQFKRYAFADPLKDACAAAFSIPVINFHDPFLKEEIHPYWNKSPRELAQFVGTEMFRTQMGERHWIKNLDLRFKIDFDSDEEICAVVTDVRFQNEIEFILSKPNSHLIYIHRSNRSYKEVGIKNHPSEQIHNLPYKEQFYEIDNNGTLTDLHQKISQFYISKIINPSLNF